MRGHLKKRGETWTMVVWDAQKQRQVWRTTGQKKKSEAERVLRAALGRADNGGELLPETVTVDQLAERFFEHRAKIGKPRPNHCRNQERLLRANVLPKIGNLEVRKVRPAHVQGVLDAYIDGHEPRTVGQLRAAISAMFAVAVEWDLTAVNPAKATRTPTAQKAKLVIPSGEEVDAIIAEAADTDWSIAILLAARTGCRRGEVCALRWANCDLDRGVLHVRESLQRVDGALVFTPPKTERAVREVPLRADVVARLREHRTAQARRRLELPGMWYDHDLIVERGDGGPVDPDSLTHAFLKIAKRAGVQCRLHDLRHAIATRLANSGLAAYETSAMLGHSSVAFTQQTYTHTDDRSVDRTRAALEGAR
jgi:integrase